MNDNSIKTVKLSPLNPKDIEAFLYPGDVILEIGSGKGNTLRYMKEKGFSITGTDINAEEECEIIRCAAEKLPFENSSFDAVIMECVFSLCSPKECASEAKRVLKPGGRLITTDIFSSGKSLKPDDIDGIKNLYSMEEYEGYFSDFRLLKKEDRTKDMINLMCEIAFREDFCISFESIKKLSLLKPRYGLWLFGKM